MYNEEKALAACLYIYIYSGEEEVEEERFQWKIRGKARVRRAGAKCLQRSASRLAFTLSVHADSRAPRSRRSGFSRAEARVKTDPERAAAAALCGLSRAREYCGEELRLSKIVCQHILIYVIQSIDLCCSCGQYKFVNSSLIIKLIITHLNTTYTTCAGEIYTVYNRERAAYEEFFQKNDN